jgi:hypothetical protein
MTTLIVPHGIDWAQDQAIADIAQAHDGICKGRDIWVVPNVQAVAAIKALQAIGYKPELQSIEND